MKPPANIPVTKIRFQFSFFQLYWKKGIFAGIQAAQICRSEELMPNVLLPNISNSGTVRPISGPDIYQGHGCCIQSIIYNKDMPPGIWRHYIGFSIGGIG